MLMWFDSEGTDRLLHLFAICKILSIVLLAYCCVG